MNLQETWYKLFGFLYLPKLLKNDIDKGFDIRAVIEDGKVNVYAKANGKNPTYPEQSEKCILSTPIEKCADYKEYKIYTCEVVTTHGKIRTHQMLMFEYVFFKNGEDMLIARTIGDIQRVAEEAGNFVT